MDLARVRRQLEKAEADRAALIEARRSVQARADFARSRLAALTGGPEAGSSHPAEVAGWQQELEEAAQELTGLPKGEAEGRKAKALRQQLEVQENAQRRRAAAEEGLARAERMEGK